MRIAFNTLHENPEAPSNAVRFIANMVNALVERGPQHNYLLYVGERSAAMFDQVHPSVIRRVFPHSNERRARRMVDEQRLVPKALGKDRVDIFHCVGGIVPFRTDVKCLLSVITMHHKVVPQEIGWSRATFRTVMFDLAVRKAHLIIANSDSNKADIMRWLPVSEEKIVRIPDALDKVFLEPTDPAVSAKVLADLGLDGPYILFASALYRYKNLETLLDAFATIKARAELRDHLLVVAGHGEEPYVRMLKSRADALGVGAATRFVGHQGAEPLRSLYAEAEAFVYPSLYETFGHPPLQAMGQGTAVIAADSSSIPEVVGDAAVLFDPRSSDALAGALALVLGDPALRAELVERGRRQCRVYNWDQTAAVVLDTYARCA